MEKDDKYFVAEVLVGNINAFSGLIDKYQKQIFRLTFKMVQDYDDAKDLTQNIFIKVYQNLSSYNPNYSFFSWTYRIAINESINFLKQKKTYKKIDKRMVDKIGSPEDIFEKNEMTKNLEKAMQSMKPELCSILVLKYFQELSYNEISEIKEWPIDKVKAKLFQARQALKKILIQKGLI